MARKRPIDSPKPIAAATVPQHPYDHAVRNRHPDAVAPEHRPEFLAVLRGFMQYEAGDDAGARDSLQAIGATSLFLDWKLLLRGLIAFQANDDARALENWQRLDPDRLAMRLAAPYRLQIDAVFATMQPDAVREQAAKTFGTPLLRALAELAPLLARDQKLAKAFTHLEKLVPLIKVERPALVPRLAGILYETVARCGEPQDLVKYRKLFNAPAEDPDFHRINALGYENGSPAESIKHWEAYEKWLKTNPPGWGPDLIRVSRALVLRHVARICALGTMKNDIPDDLMAAFEQILGRRGGISVTKAPLPDPMKYWEAAFALNPADEETTADLIVNCERQAQPEAAVAFARRHLAAKPDSLDVLNDLGKLLTDLGRTFEAYELYEAALKTNPLDKDLRRCVSATAHGALRIELSKGGARDLTARLLSAAVDHDTTSQRLMSYSILAILTRKHKEAEQCAKHEAKLEAIPHGRLAVAAMLAADATMAKLKPAERKPFDERLKQMLAGPVTVAEAMTADSLFGRFSECGIDYRGRGTTEKKVQALLLTAVKTDATANERLLIGLGKIMVGMAQFDRLEKAAAAMHDRFPMNPWFTLFLAECVLGKAFGKPPQWRKLDAWTSKTRRLMRNHPDLKWIEMRLEKISDPTGPVATDDYLPHKE